MAKSVTTFMDLDKLREDFEYHNHGRLVRTTCTGGRVSIGDVAGCLCGNGYRTIKYKRYRNLEHRLVWMWFNGHIPDDKCIDHINRNRSDNRIENLRLVTPRENHYNASIDKRNTTGVSGVQWSNSINRWRVRLSAEYLGVYKCFLDACCVRKSAENKQWSIK